jgi:Predicted transcription factor, homolog of eukaryotic MBF1
MLRIPNEKPTLNERTNNMAQMSGVSTTERGTTAIAQRLAKLRQDAGITQLELAKKLKTTQSIVSRYERGELRIHAELLLELSKILGVTPNDIVGVSKKDTTNGKIPRRFLTRLRNVHLLTKREQDTLAQTLDLFFKGASK